MGLFEDIGRKVETFKKQAESVSEDQARAKCPECETLIYSDRTDCPECGHDNLLVRRDSADPADADSDPTDSDSADDLDPAGDIDPANDIDTDPDTADGDGS